MHFHQHDFTLETLFIYCKAEQATDRIIFYFLLSNRKRVKSLINFLKSEMVCRNIKCNSSYENSLKQVY